MGSDLAKLKADGTIKVSIHAPAWGATAASQRRRKTRRVSIHAPAWGATGLAEPDPDVDGRFNSRSRMGSDTRRHNAY